MSMTYKGPYNPNPGDGEAHIIIYGYVPSLAFGIVGVITFASVFLAHSYWCWVFRGRRKGERGTDGGEKGVDGSRMRTGRENGKTSRGGKRTFHILIVVGTLMEIGGYAARLASHRRPFLVSSFVAQYFLIVVAPVLFSAAIYLSLSLAAASYDALSQGASTGRSDILVIKGKYVLSFFVTADVITTIIQVVGAALIGSSESARVSGGSSSVTPEQANDILLAGLACQCFSFLCFLSVLSLALYRRSHIPIQPVSSAEVQPAAAMNHASRVKRLLYIILSTSLLILLRTIFRLAETAQGFFGFASTHEALFGTLEYLPVVLAVGIWAVAPPGKFLTTG